MHRDASAPAAEIARLAKELSATAPVAAGSEELEGYRAQRADLEAMLAELGEADEDRELLLAEVEATGSAAGGKGRELEGLLVRSFLARRERGADPASAADPSSCVLEVRPGTGGDEAGFFALELLECYKKGCEAGGLEWAPIEVVMTSAGGLKEATVEVASPPYAGTKAYDLLRHESGVHRVQRVPSNDVKIHTSACSVVAIPSAPERFAESFPKDDLRIDVYRASGAGGQHVNTTESAVRITHLPTNTVVCIQDERSQHKNKAKAMKVLGARVAEQMREEDARRAGELRGALNATGNRSDRIRTYNFKDDRVTDHRVKETVFGCKEMVGAGTVVEQFWGLLEELKAEAVMESMDEAAEKDEAFMERWRKANN
ncbi:hypothetical protein TeGR_g12180 [Tetraparma gracilis]|uniref:Prokaryotic-type class I peptide chain release factors domain-containing protein n=1 Tax=Tetraparma gracilis TaxID=2962635 RepID=A0ABQ6MVE3_9STRA|nr:hypothetical protein TeGR_g12180 [Tetraparma gracilis]